MDSVPDEVWMLAKDGDDAVHVAFHKHARVNEEKSATEGRPIYDEVDYVKIMVPGDKQNIIDRPVSLLDKQRFAAQYERWRSGAVEVDSGTPLSQWPAISRAQAEELAHFKVRTVEQLAALSDSNAQNIGPIQALKKKAKDFIEAAKGNAPLAKLRDEVEAKNSEMANLQRIIKEQGDAIAALQKKATKQA